MKLLLCHPNQYVSFEGIKARPMVGPPLGILLIAGYLRESPWKGNIEIYDARVSAKIYTNEINQQIFGDTNDEICKRIQNAKPDVVGISNMFSSQIERAYSMAVLVRSVMPTAIIVIGGPHVTVFPSEALKKAPIDYVILGEGEERFTSLMIALSSNKEPAIEGIVSRKNQDRNIGTPKISFINDIDKLPLPAYDLIDLELYFKLSKRGYSPRFREWGKRPVTVITSRGCPQVCSFCSIHTTMGYRYRFHSPDYVKKHIMLLVEKYGVDFIHFEDDNFTHLPERYDEIIEIISNTKEVLGWDTPNGIRGDTWTFDRVKKAKQSGCQFLTVAIESPVPRVLNKIVCKGLNLEHVENLIHWCNEVKLRLHALYIIGFPDEKMDEMKTTVKYALYNYRKYGVTPFLQPLVPIPNTPIYKKIISGTFFKNKLEIKYNQITTDEFNPIEVQSLYRKYQFKRIGIFVLRTLTNYREFYYNCKLMFKYPHAIFHALMSAVKAKS